MQSTLRNHDSAGSPIDDLELMRLHVEALFTHDDDGRMRTVNELGGAAAPRLFLGRTAEGRLLRFRHDVDAATVDAIETLCDELPYTGRDGRGERDAAALSSVLAGHGAVERVWSGPAFRFPEPLPEGDETLRLDDSSAGMLRPHLEEWLGDVGLCQPFFAVLRDGAAVSLCCSVRTTAHAHEAGVETSPAFRGHGYASHVVTAWARAVRDIGRVPLYSTSWENTASLAVAHKLGLVRYGDDLHIT